MNNEKLKSWLSCIKCDQYYKNFVENGYDLIILTRMTPQDLTAIGVKSPEVRKKLLAEIKKLDIKDGIPDSRFSSLQHWLEKLKLEQYYERLCDEGYNTIDKVCKLTWEDFEDIGIYKLGHQKMLLLGIEALKKYDKIQEERLNDSSSPYDVNPNHRMSLRETNGNKMSTIGRATLRSGFFGTRSSGATLNTRSVPVATVMPALKHVSNPILPQDILQKQHSLSICSNDSNSNGVYGSVTEMSLLAPEVQVNSSNYQTDANSNQAHSQIQQQPIYELTTREQIYKIGINHHHHQRPLSIAKKVPPPLPPIRTNSLKSQSMSSNHPSVVNNDNSNSIYGNNCNFIQANGNTNPNAFLSNNGPTSFLRTPKLGTLTATTNKMLLNGGHIETLQTSMSIASIPVREAPPPPSFTVSNQPIIPEKIEEEELSRPLQMDGPSIDNVDGIAAGLLSASSSNQVNTHHLNDDMDFPPPPPPSMSPLNA